MEFFFSGRKYYINFWDDFISNDFHSKGGQQLFNMDGVDVFENGWPSKLQNTKSRPFLVKT
jgi:hypothetical protein